MDAQATMPPQMPPSPPAQLSAPPAPHGGLAVWQQIVVSVAVAVATSLIVEKILGRKR